MATPLAVKAAAVEVVALVDVGVCQRMPRKARMMLEMPMVIFTKPRVRGSQHQRAKAPMTRARTIQNGKVLLASFKADTH